MWENISVRGCKQNKEYSKCKTQGFNRAVSKGKPLQIDGHTNIDTCINANISVALTVASSLKKENNAAQAKPTLPSLSNTWSHWEASQPASLSSKAHSGATLDFILRTLHLISIGLIPAKLKWHTEQALRNKYICWWDHSAGLTCRWTRDHVGDVIIRGLTYLNMLPLHKVNC